MAGCVCACVHACVCSCQNIKDFIMLSRPLPPNEDNKRAEIFRGGLLCTVLWKHSCRHSGTSPWHTISVISMDLNKWQLIISIFTLFLVRLERNFLEWGKGHFTRVTSSLCSPRYVEIFNTLFVDSKHLRNLFCSACTYSLYHFILPYIATNIYDCDHCARQYVTIRDSFPKTS